LSGESRYFEEGSQQSAAQLT